MPHRINHLYEQVLTEENCIKAILIGTDKLRRTNFIKIIRANPQKYGRKLLKILQQGWVPRTVRYKTINEDSSRKTRNLTIPRTLDHLIHVAIMLPLIDELMKRYDDFSCGSIPKKGQAFAQTYMRSWVQGDYKYEFAAEADVHHFYASCKKEVVLERLSRIIKDKRYLQFHEKILDQMGGTIAIGFQPSHWYGNLVLTYVDNALRVQCGKVKFIRYMDNYILLARTKKELHQAINVIKDKLNDLNLKLNNSYQVFPISSRNINLLSYRYFQKKIILRKSTMFHMNKRIHLAKKNNCAHFARSMISSIGLLKHCNSYHFLQSHVYPNLNLDNQRRLISHDDKKSSIRGKPTRSESNTDW